MKKHLLIFLSSENVRNVLREPKPLFQGITNSFLFFNSNYFNTFRFLEFLSLLVNEPGNSKLTQQFLPMIIELCTTALYPAICEVYILT
jgi:hypothetical protein